MKTKTKFLLAALVMLFSIGAKAQSGSTPIKGDVNGDGVVDVADINAIIQIIKNGAGTGAEAVDGYYWYVGQTDPNTMTTISPIVNDNTSWGWRLIGSSLPTYNSSNALYKPVNGEYIIMPNFAKYYVIIPNECNAVPRDGIGSDASTTDIFTKWNNTITLNGVVYKVYESIGRARNYDLEIY